MDKVRIEKRRLNSKEIFYRVYFDRDKENSFEMSIIYKHNLDTNELKAVEISADVEDYEDYFRTELKKYIDDENKLENQSYTAKDVAEYYSAVSVQTMQRWARPDHRMYRIFKALKNQMIFENIFS